MNEEFAKRLRVYNEFAMDFKRMMKTHSMIEIANLMKGWKVLRLSDNRLDLCKVINGERINVHCAHFGNYINCMVCRG